MQESQLINQKLEFLFNSLSNYIEYKGDAEGFAKSMEKKLEDIQKENDSDKQRTINKDSK